MHALLVGWFHVASAPRLARHPELEHVDVACPLEGWVADVIVPPLTAEVLTNELLDTFVDVASKFELVVDGRHPHSGLHAHCPASTCASHSQRTIVRISFENLVGFTPERLVHRQTLRVEDVCAKDVIR
eukprot:6373831-Pyramimonas_sp.AAC.1